VLRPRPSSSGRACPVATSAIQSVRGPRGGSEGPPAERVVNAMRRPSGLQDTWGGKGAIPGRRAEEKEGALDPRPAPAREAWCTGGHTRAMRPGRALQVGPVAEVRQTAQAASAQRPLVHVGAGAGSGSKRPGARGPPGGALGGALT
jgi:hypothetical protein